jgi:hypothetical protein
MQASTLVEGGAAWWEGLGDGYLNLVIWQLISKLLK